MRIRMMIVMITRVGLVVVNQIRISVMMRAMIRVIRGMTCVAWGGSCQSDSGRL